MIARIWRGATRAADAEVYEAYVQETGIAHYKHTPGNLGAWLLTRIVDDRCEFIALSYWESREAITAFAGADINKAVYYPEDDRYLIERAEEVEHYDIKD